MLRFSILLCASALVLSGCGGARNLGSDAPRSAGEPPRDAAAETTSIWELLRPPANDTQVSVNRYLWNASLEVLGFLPVQSVDPFTGVIVTGYGVPPGGGRAYRATVLIDDPALDARSLNLSLQTRGGRAVSKATARAVEDAILSRAREMRISDNKF